MDPRIILRCLRLPSALGSRHLNSQTSGPRCLSARITLPFCMDFLSASGMICLGLVLVAQSGHKLCSKLPRKEMINVGECARGYRFAAEIPRVAGVNEVAVGTTIADRPPHRSARALI